MEELSIDGRVYFFQNVICSCLSIVTKIHDEKTLESSGLLQAFSEFWPQTPVPALAHHES